MKILFYDVTSPIAYTNLSLGQQAVRGTEGTVIRIAHQLKHFHTVYIAQHCRSAADDEIRDGVSYLSLSTAHQLHPDVVVLLRDSRLIETMVKRYQGARHFLWMHNLPSSKLHDQCSILAKHGYEIIAVSHFHRMMIEKRLKGKWYQRLFGAKDHEGVPVHVIYNPIEDSLCPDDTPYNKQQMIFTSASYKGLSQTLKQFASVRDHFADYELLIISPDALRDNIKLPTGARVIGPLPPNQVIQHIRESFCVFYPQTQRVETFGLVYAEANAVGTPVLAHDFGAAREVLSSPDQLVNGHCIHDIIQKIAAWRNHRPATKGREIFRLNQVLETWLRLLNK